MMAVRRACSVVLVGAFAAAGLAGCSSGRVPRRSQCCSAPNAFALDVTTAGRVRWQVPLDGPAAGSNRLPPLAVGADAVFAQSDVLYGLRLTDGHQMWSRVISQGIAGMWQWQAQVIVLTDGAGASPLLVGVDATSGEIRWTRVIAGSVEASYPTADGGLAMLRGDDTLEVMDLSSGQVRWTRPAGYPPDSGQGDPPPMTADGGAVVLAVNGRLTSYDDRTGRIRWADELMAIRLGAALGELSLQAAAGIVYLSGAVYVHPGGQWTQVLLGVSAADGRVKWQSLPGPRQTQSNYAPGLMSVTSTSGATRQDELDPTTGRVRWQVASSYDATATVAGIVTAPGPATTDQISLHDTLTGHTRWTARLAGLNLGWQEHAPVLPVFPAGPLLAVPTGGPAGPNLIAAFRMSDGHRAWKIAIPAQVAAPPSAVPGGILVYCADRRFGL